MMNIYKRGRLAVSKLRRNLFNPEDPPISCVETFDYCQQQAAFGSLIEYEAPKEDLAVGQLVTCFPPPAPKVMGIRGVPPNHLNFLLKLKFGRIHGCGSVITPDNRLLRDLSIEWNLLFNQGKLDHSLRHGGRLPKRRTMKGRVLLLESRTAENYYHFLFDCVSRFRLGEKYLNEVDWVYISANTPVQKEILACLKIPPEKVLPPSEEVYYEFDEVLAASVPGPSLATCAWLRERLAPCQPTAKRKRIYVSRQDSTSRRALNEAEVEAFLSGYGFESIRLNGRTFASQVELFVGAEVVVGLHGAGLANLVFCRPGTKVVEILPAWYPNPIFVQLAHACGLNHVLCLSNGERSEVESRGKDDFVVNLESLISALKALEL